MGIVQDIIYLNGKTPKDSLPNVVMVEFHNWHAPAFLSQKPNLIPIVPIKEDLAADVEDAIVNRFL